MSRLHFILPAVAALAMAASVPAWATPSRDTGAVSPSPAVQTVAKMLPPITVYGHRVPLPVALQIIKTGLKLPWTNNLNDTRIRCRVHKVTGSLFPNLYCESNRHHVKRMNRLHTALTTVESGAGGTISATLVVFEPHINVSALRGLLRKIPPAGASYTLRVTDDDGKPVLGYVIKNGEVAHIYHYVYKKVSDSAKH
jgi:hypothetical protein